MNANRALVEYPWSRPCQSVKSCFEHSLPLSQRRTELIISASTEQNRRGRHPVATRRMVALYDYDPRESSPNVDVEVLNALPYMYLYTIWFSIRWIHVCRVADYVLSVAGWIDILCWWYRCCFWGYRWRRLLLCKSKLLCWPLTLLYSEPWCTIVFCFFVFQGELNGHRGLVPSNFLEEVPDDVEVYLTDTPSHHDQDGPNLEPAPHPETKRVHHRRSQR